MQLTMKTYVFPGQGSQNRGMGNGLFDTFNDVCETADRVLGYSIKDLCLHDPHNLLNQTQYSQPAIFVVNALSYLKATDEGTQQPDFLAGHSLGEYNALLASGAFDLETGLKLVNRRGELMARAKGGGMAAVIGMNKTQVRKILNNNYFFNLDISNYNSAEQIVISGLKADIESAAPAFEQGGAKLYRPLNVSGAFHSRFMNSSALDFLNYLEEFEFSKLAIPVISNVHARPYEPGSIRSNLADQINSPVRWTETIEYLINQGDMDFEELGCGRVLTNLIAKIRASQGPIAAG